MLKKFWKTDIWKYAAAIFLLSCCICRAGVSGFCVIYQPIIVQGDCDDSERAPKGYRVLPVPFLKYHYHGAQPYDAIAFPHVLMTDAPREVWMHDANLLSQSGVRIGCTTGLEDEKRPLEVSLLMDDFHSPQYFSEKMTDDDVAEAALECIRLMANEARQHPILKIRGKKGDEEKWQKWEELFNKHDFTKPFRLKTK